MQHPEQTTLVMLLECSRRCVEDAFFPWVMNIYMPVESHNSNLEREFGERLFLSDLTQMRQRIEPKSISIHLLLKSTSGIPLSSLLQVEVTFGLGAQ